ncbi:hypothetical protein ACFL3Q_01525 [Planctomycetota bacterium]
MSKKISIIRDAFVSAIISMVITALLLVLIAYRFYYGIIPVGVGVITFTVVLFHHPGDNRGTPYLFPEQQCAVHTLPDY